MNGNIDRYEIFLATARLGNITAAAEQLGYTQSGVSRAIAMLEEECGFTLFVRSKKGVRLTANGEQLLEPIRTLVHDREHLAQVVDEIKGLSSGIVRIGTFTSVSVNWLPEMIKGFQQQYPGISFQLYDGGYGEIVEWLETGEIDCGFLSNQVPTGLHFTPIDKDPMLAVLPVEHPLSKQKEVRVEQLAEEDFLIPGGRNDADIRQVLAQINLKPNVKYVLNNELAIAAMVAQGHGVTILPELIIKGHDFHVCLRPISPPCYREIGLASRKLRYISPTTRCFIDYITQLRKEGKV